MILNRRSSRLQRRVVIAAFSSLPPDENVPVRFWTSLDIALISFLLSFLSGLPRPSCMFRGRRVPPDLMSHMSGAATFAVVLLFSIITAWVAASVDIGLTELSAMNDPFTTVIYFQRKMDVAIILLACHLRQIIQFDSGHRMLPSRFLFALVGTDSEKMKSCDSPSSKDKGVHALERYGTADRLRASTTAFAHGPVARCIDIALDELLSTSRQD